MWRLMILKLSQDIAKVNEFLYLANKLKHNKKSEEKQAAMKDQWGVDKFARSPLKPVSPRKAWQRK
jgi:hypothetical protein